MTTYRGTWNEGLPSITAFDDDVLEPFELTAVRAQNLRGSCQGFSWGYRGSGPNCTALALLLDVFEVEQALELYADFALTFVDRWKPGTDWTITSAEIEAWAQCRRTQPTTIIEVTTHAH